MISEEMGSGGKVINVKRKAEDIDFEMDKLGIICNRLDKDRSECFQIKEKVERKAKEIVSDTDSIYYDATNSNIELKKGTKKFLKDLWEG